MVPPTICRRCRRYRLRCDGAIPCVHCKANGVRCSAGPRATPIRSARPSRAEAGPVTAASDAAVAEGAAEDDRSGGRGTLTRFSPEPVPDDTETGGSRSDVPSDIAFDPIPSQYREAQIIFDGIDYCENLSLLSFLCRSLYTSVLPIMPDACACSLPAKRMRVRALLLSSG